jgi:peptidoglycan/xylan/chitin deacetylase (PgdA/CDA1 family)
MPHLLHPFVGGCALATLVFTAALAAETTSEPVADPGMVTAAAATALTHTVAKGDTLHKIAKQHGTTVESLKSTNRLESDLIRIGQTLVLPGGGTAAGEVSPFKPRYFRCEVEEPLLALTFDDGPHPEHTPVLLDLLRERNIRATFFVLGQRVASKPGIVRRMAAEGHEVASHSWSHPQFTRLKMEAVESQLSRTHDMITKACGVAPKLYRPPYGSISLNQQRIVQQVFGYPAILWDVDTLDWQTPRNPEKVRDAVFTQARAGSIVLMHDIHPTTIEAVPEILDGLVERGFHMVTVSELLQHDTATPRTHQSPDIAPIQSDLESQQP